MWMGVNSDNSIAWVESFKIDNFVGNIVEAPAGAKPGMVFTGAVVETAPSTVEEEERWVEGQMLVADRGVNLHLDGDVRASANQLAWQKYRCALRDYIKNGVVSGDRPKAPK